MIDTRVEVEIGQRKRLLVPHIAHVRSDAALQAVARDALFSHLADRSQVKDDGLQVGDFCTTPRTDALREVGVLS